MLLGRARFFPGGDSGKSEKLWLEYYSKGICDLPRWKYKFLTLKLDLLFLEIKPKFANDFRSMLYKIYQYTVKQNVDDYMGISIDFLAPKGRTKKHRCFLHT